MNYHLKTRHKNGNWLAIFLILFFCLIIILNFSRPRLMSSPLLSIGKPLWKMEDSLALKLSSFGAYLTSKANLQKENDRLKTALSEMQLTKEQDALLEAENQSLKEVLGRTDISQKVLAYILRKPGDSPYDTLVLDTGSDNGVSVGDEIISPSGHSLGQVSNVYAGTAIGKLYSTAGERVTVVLSGTKVAVEAVGRGGGNFEIKVPQGLAVSLGEAIILPNAANEVIGTVENIENDSAHSLNTILFKSAVNIQELSYVLIKKHK